jgi:flavodoxin
VLKIKNMKTAIVYYSRTGNTKNAVGVLKKELEKKEHEVDLIKIEAEEKPRFFKANKAAIKQNKLPIKNSDYDISKYKTIIIGVPSWASNPAPFYISFLDKIDGIEDKKFAIFITGGRSIQNNESAIDILKNKLKKYNIKNIDGELILKMRRGRIINGEKNITSFIERICG